MVACNSNNILSGPDNPNFLATNYFQFKVSRIPDFTFFVQSANLPMLSTRTLNQPTTLGTYPKIPATNYYFDDLVVTFMVNADMSNWLEIYNWLRGIGNLTNDNDNFSYSSGDSNNVFSNATLIITNSQYKPLKQVNFHYVFPRTLGGINFTSTATSTDPITCSVNFSYSYYTIGAVGATG